MKFINASTSETEKEDQETLLSSNQLVEKHKCLTLGGVRWWIFKAKHDPRLRDTFFRIGRRVYWREQKLLKYLEDLNEESLSKEGRGSC